MTRDDIIRMAQEACEVAPREDWNSTAWVLSDEGLERFAALVAAAEREACAKVCEELDTEYEAVCQMTSMMCSQAIRARGQA